MTQAKNPFVAMSTYVQAIDKVLSVMKQPAQVNKIPEHRAKLKEILSEAIVNFQKSLLVANSGGAGLIQKDPIGFTIAKTAYSHPDAIAKNKYSALVDEICQEILDEQQATSEQNQNLISEQNILAAQTDSKDDSKTDINLVSNLVDTGTVDENGNAIFEQSHLEINKETGDTVVHERKVVKDKDGNILSDTGMEKKGFFARAWANVKDFCKNIWGWLKAKWNGFSNWVKSFFTEPEDQDVIMANAE